MSRGEPEAMAYWGEIYAKEKRGVLASKCVVCSSLLFSSSHLPCSPVQTGLKLRPSPEELQAIGPKFTKRWNEYYANAPDKSILFMGAVSMYAISLLAILVEC